MFFGFHLWLWLCRGQRGFRALKTCGRCQQTQPNSSPRWWPCDVTTPQAGVDVQSAPQPCPHLIFFLVFFLLADRAALLWWIQAVITSWDPLCMVEGDLRDVFGEAPVQVSCAFFEMRLFFIFFYLLTEVLCPENEPFVHSRKYVSLIPFFTLGLGIYTFHGVFW